MSKLLKSQAVSLPETKSHQGKYLTKHVGFIRAEAKKAKKVGKVIMRKVATSREKVSKTQNRQRKTRPISVCECLSVIFKMLH